MRHRLALVVMAFAVALSITWGMAETTTIPNQEIKQWADNLSQVRSVESVDGSLLVVDGVEKRGKLSGNWVRVYASDGKLQLAIVRTRTHEELQAITQDESLNKAIYTKPTTLHSVVAGICDAGMYKDNRVKIFNFAGKLSYVEIGNTHNAGDLAVTMTANNKVVSIRGWGFSVDWYADSNY